MVDETRIAELAARAVRSLTNQGLWLATAESCTGGWIAKALTDVPGSSRCFGCGIVSYSNRAKRGVLGVRSETLSGEGAVSEAVVREMSEGVLALSDATIAVAVSGIAGPDGGTIDKPVGTVWFAWSRRVGEQIVTDAERCRYDGDRTGVRIQTVEHALAGILARIPGDG